MGSPAHAGIDLAPFVKRMAWGRFPRTRGDRPASQDAEAVELMVPPHTRG